MHFLTIEFPAVFVTDRTVDLAAITAAGNTVVVEERMRATLMKGRHFDNDYCFVFELSNGLIRRVCEYMDTRRAEEMFGNNETTAAT